MISTSRIQFALRCYQERKGSLPASLEELVPEYLKEIPLDPFDGKPIRYSKEKKIIYSEEAPKHRAVDSVKIEF